MKRDLLMTRPLKSSFLSCEKDIETILKKLFINSQPHSEILKRLLVIPMKDCLDENNEKYTNIVKNITLADLRKDGYIKLEPKIRLPEHEEIKAYIIISFDGFTMNPTNPEFRDCDIIFHVFSAIDYWELDNYSTRPLKILGYIDGLLNKSRLTGIGTLLFSGAGQILTSSDYSGYSLTFNAIHGSDDLIPPEG